MLEGRPLRRSCLLACRRQRLQAGAAAPCVGIAAPGVCLARRQEAAPQGPAPWFWLRACSLLPCACQLLASFWLPASHSYRYTAEDVDRLLREKKAKGMAPRNAGGPRCLASRHTLCMAMLTRRHFAALFQPVTAGVDQPCLARHCLQRAAVPRRLPAAASTPTPWAGAPLACACSAGKGAPGGAAAARAREQRR